MRRILAMAAAWSLFSLPSLAVACAISCDSAACEASAPACRAHQESRSNGEEPPLSSSHCPGFHSAAAVSAVPRTFSGVGSEGLVQGYALLVTSGSPLGRVAAHSSARPNPRSRSAPSPLRI